MVHLQAAVGIDQHQRARLIEVLGGERDAELDRGQRQPTLEHRALAVESGNLGATGLIVGAGFQLTDQFRQYVMGDGLAVVGGIAAGAVEIALAHLQRVQSQITGNVIHRLFDHHHALRAAKAAEGGVGDRVGLAAVAGHPRLIKVIGIVGVEHGPLDNRIGQVRREAATAGYHDLGALNYALLVKTDVVGVEEVVALAGLHHVIRAREPILDRPPGGIGQQRGHTGDRRGLGFLATKAATHAAYRGRHRMQRDAQHLGHQLLHFGRVLAGRVHKHAAIFLRQRQAGLAFQVKVFLPADVDLALQAVRCSRQCGVRITALLGVTGAHEELFGQCLAGIKDGRQILVFDLGQLRCLARGGVTGRGDGKDRLADMLDHLTRQHRITREHRADVGVTGYVGHGEYGNHAGVGTHGFQIESGDTRMRPGAVAHRCVQQAFGLRQVVNITGGAGYMQPGAFMQGALTGNTERLATRTGYITGQFTHSRSPSAGPCRHRRRGIHTGRAAAGCRLPWCGSWPRRAHRTAA